MNLLLELDRDLSEVIFGPQYGRPTISRVVGRAISRQTGWTVEGSTDVFHGLLGIAAVALLVRAAK